LIFRVNKKSMEDKKVSQAKYTENKEKIPLYGIVNEKRKELRGD